MARSSAAARNLEPVGGVVVMPEESLTISDGSTIRDFLKNAGEFFGVARRIENEARLRLQTAQQLRMPTTLEADVEIQLFIKTCNGAVKAATEHWDITSLFHGFHKRLVAARKRAEEPNTEAGAIAQRLHNQYVDQEKRRAAEEEDRLRREETRKAEADRQRDLARLEEQALKAEVDSPTLSEREERFAHLIWQNFDMPATAARMCGYKDHERQAERLMAMPKIQQAIDAKKLSCGARQQAEALKSRPVETRDVRVAANVQSIGTDRTTWGATVYDGEALLNAAIEDEMMRRAGKAAVHGVPLDVLMVNPVVVNKHGQSMHEAIDKWPGVRHTKKTKTI